MAFSTKKQMKWIAYINKRTQFGIITLKKVFRFGETRADMRAAVLHASKLFNYPDDDILCIPAPCPTLYPKAQ